MLDLEVVGGESLLIFSIFFVPSSLFRLSGIKKGGKVFLSLLTSKLSKPKNSTEKLTQGAGFVWPTRVGNLEVDFVKVLAAQPNDLSRTGLTLGFAPRV